MNKEKRLANLGLLFFSSVSLLLLILPLTPVVNTARLVLGYVFLPSVKNAESLVRYMGGVSGNAVRLIRTEDENRLLRGKIKDTQITQARLDAALEENKRLAQIAGIAPSLKWKGVWARVIEREPMRWYSSVLVDKGSLDGVALSNAVLGVQGGKAALAGKIIEVAKDTAKVLLVTDEMSSVACYVEGKGWDGLAEGQGAELLKLNYMPPEAQAAAGLEILTSPASAVFPPGITVGRIIKFFPKEGVMSFVPAQVLPAVRPGAIKEVFIITDFKSGAD